MAASFLRLLAFLTGLAFLTFVNAIPSSLHSKKAAASLASKDGFYAVPNGLDDVKPGTILKHRKPPAPIAAFREYRFNIDAAHQILYRTTDSSGNPTATVLTVLVPYNADFDKVLSYQVAEDASSDYCAPSYVFQLDSKTGPDDGTSTTQIEILLIESALEQGWVVIVPDFEGPKAAFLGNRLGGQATLDGIRAAIQSTSFTGIQNNPTITMWGYSGGAFVTGWAAEIQPTYAPELEIAGAVLGGTTPDIGSVLQSVNGGRYSGLIPAGILGMGMEFPEFAAAIQENVKPEFKERLYTALDQCSGANFAAFEDEDIVSMFKDGFLTSSQVVMDTLAKNNLGHSTPKIPLFIYKSVQDEVSVVADTDALVTKYCNAGTRVEYVRDLFSNHGSLAVLGAFRALDWLKDVMDGEIPSAACSKRTMLTSLIDVATIEFLPKVLVDALLDFVGKPVGPIF